MSAPTEGGDPFRSPLKKHIDDELTPEEARTYLNEQTRRLYGLGLDEFIRAAEAGELDTHAPMYAHLVMLTGAKAKM